MAIIVNDNYSVNAPKPADSRYLNNRTPWVSVSEVNSNIPISYRYTGLTVNIAGVEYWYMNDIEDVGLVEKNTGVGSVGNGLTLNGDIISLGGNLTGNTIFNGGVDKFVFKYTAKYWDNYDNRTLVDKEYVDSVAGGVRPKQAVMVATTENITLSGLTTIDGYLLIEDTRILVKDQTDLTENGVYSASSGSWSRTTDFDDSSEVVSGTYMYVLSGDTNKNFSYVLTTEDPITVGTDDLIFVEFAKFQTITSGTGITVVDTGGEFIVNIDGSSIAGDKLDWNGSQLNVDSDTAYVSDYGVTGATSGICKYGNHDISLGGELSGDTSITLPYDSITTFCVGNGDFSGNWYGGALSINRDNSVSSNNLAMLGARHDADNYSIINLNATTGITLTTKSSTNERTVLINNSGVTYGDDYSGSFVNRSLVDKEYVDNAVDNIGEYMFTSDILVSLSSGKSFGRYVNGDTIPASGKTPSEVILLSVIEPITPTLGLTSVGNSVEFGAETKTVNLSISRTVNSLDATIASVLLEYSRGGGSWITLTTNTGSTSYIHTIDDSLDRFNTGLLTYRYTLVDSTGASGSTTHTVTPQAYSSPSISITYSANTLSYETLTLREVGNVLTRITGSATSNRSNVNITGYIISRSTNGGAYENIHEVADLNATNITINSFEDTGTTSNATSVRYRVTVTDEYTTTNSSINNITFRYASYFGYSTDKPLNAAQILSLGRQALNTSLTRTVSSVTSAASEYTYYSYPSTFGDLSNVILDGASPVLGAFDDELSNVDVINNYGETISYRVYVSNDTGAFTDNTLSFS